MGLFDDDELNIARGVVRDMPEFKQVCVCGQIFIRDAILYNIYRERLRNASEDVVVVAEADDDDDTMNATEDVVVVEADDDDDTRNSTEDVVVVEDDDDDDRRNAREYMVMVEDDDDDDTRNATEYVVVVEHDDDDEAREMRRRPRNYWGCPCSAAHSQDVAEATDARTTKTPQTPEHGSGAGTPKMPPTPHTPIHGKCASTPKTPRTPQTPHGRRAGYSADAEQAIRILFREDIRAGLIRMSEARAKRNAYPDLSHHLRDFTNTQIKDKVWFYLILIWFRHIGSHGPFQCLNGIFYKM